MTFTYRNVKDELWRDRKDKAVDHISHAYSYIAWNDAWHNLFAILNNNPSVNIMWRIKNYSYNELEGGTDEI